MFDVFASAGRDWAVLIEGRDGESALEPRVVARGGAQALRVANGVKIVPDAGLDTIPDVVCVPEAAIMPDSRLNESHRTEIDWLRRCHAAGAIVATACSGAILLAETGLL